MKTTPGRHWSRVAPDKSVAIVAAYCAGGTAQVVAGEFKVTRNTVLRHVHLRSPECIRRRGPKRGPRKPLR